jgi:hypothetical protein
MIFEIRHGFEPREQGLVPRELVNYFSHNFVTFFIKKSTYTIMVQLSNLDSVINLMYSAVIQYNLIVLIDHYIRVQYTVNCVLFKGSLTRDFRLQVFFMNQCPPGPKVFHWGRFQFFRKTIQWCQRHRRKINPCHGEITKNPKIFRRCQRHRQKTVHRCQRHRR